jgi:hypothetical protein
VRALLSFPLGLLALGLATLSARLFDEEGPARVRHEWLRHLARLPRRLAHDAWLLGAVFYGRLRGRRPAGGFRWVTLESGPEAAGKRSLARVALSFCPNTYVIDVDREHGRLLVHQLARPVVSGASWEVLL